MEIRRAGCKEIATKSDWEAALCTSLPPLRPCCIYPWIQLLWCNRVLTLGGATDQKRVFTWTRKELRAFHSLPFSAGAGVRWLPLAAGNGSGTVGSLWLLSSRRNNRGTETVFNVSISHSGCRRSHVPELQINAAPMGVQSNTKQSYEFWGIVSLVRIKESVISKLLLHRINCSRPCGGWCLITTYSKERLQVVLVWIICKVRQASLRIRRLNIARQIVGEKMGIKCKRNDLICNTCLFFVIRLVWKDKKVYPGWWSSLLHFLKMHPHFLILIYKKCHSNYDTQFPSWVLAQRLVKAR